MSQPTQPPQHGGTPRSDQAAFDGGQGIGEVTPSDFGRTLERELIAATAFADEETARYNKMSEKEAEARLALTAALVPHLSPASDALHGTLTRAGAFPIRDEEVTGYLVTCTREELERVKHLPMMQRVVVVAASDARDSVRLDSKICDLVNEGRGVVEFGITDNGQIGVWLYGKYKAAGIGNTVSEALDAAIASQSAQGEKS